MINLFPRSGFDQSVTTPVLVGVLVAWFFTETFGWVFAGLVVPGYLASVFLLDPAGGWIDVFEAFLTYGIARLIGEHLPQTGVLSRAFGRERFFLVVVVSILVRIGVEGYALPRLFPHSGWAFSVGLVVVPLAANACWKTGLFRGVVQNGVPTLIVFLILRYVLVPHTNLSLEGFELETANVGAKFLSSPKAYILLLSGAVIAASANVRYGWDFNGILVPALVGLVLVEPTKLGATFVETLIVYAAALVLIRVTPLRRANIEGPRRLVLFFAIDYALRFAFALALGRSLPGGDIVAFTGFGYLLPTLLAVKISQKASAPLVLLPTLKVSIAGFALGTLLGFTAHRIDVAYAAPPAAPGIRQLPAAPADPRAAALWVGATALVDSPEPVMPKELDRATLRARLEAAASGDDAAAAALGLDLWRLDDGVVLLRERSETFTSRVGAPSYLVRSPIRSSPSVVLVPEPIAHPTLALVAGGRVLDRSADVAVIAGVEEPSSVGLETVAHSISRTLAQHGTLAVLRASGGRPRTRGVLARFAESDPGGDLREIAETIDEGAVAKTFAPPPAAPTPLDTSLAMGLALDDVHATSKEVDLEHQAVVRRFVLPALLGEPTPSIRAVAPFVASSLGYTWSDGGRWIDGSEATALFPSAPDRAIAVLARKNGEHRRILVAPFATDRPRRDIALRLGIALRVDAIVLGQTFDHALRSGLVRAALATLRAPHDGSRQTIFMVREDVLGSQTASLSAFLDDGTALAEAKGALAAIGAEVAERPMDPAMREIAVRTAPEPKTFVTITIGEAGLQGVSLDAVRHVAALLDGGVRAFDGSLPAAAASLQARASTLAPTCSEDLDVVVRAAGSELSVTAARRLTAEMKRGCAVATIDRAAKGGYLAVIARTPSRTMLVTASLDGGGSFASVTKPSFAECIALPAAHGVCTEARR
jgi:hypothetical protein